MKKLAIFLCIYLFSMPIMAQFKLNTNPQNPSRMPDWKTEVGIVLSHNSPTITIGGANNSQSTNFLPVGVLVIVDQKTLIAKWVAICGNEVLTSWKPRGKIIFFETPDSYENACEKMLSRLEGKLDNLQRGVDELLKRDYSGSFLELRFMLSEAIKNNNASLTTSNPLSPEWTTGNTVGAGTFMLTGGLIGGFGFKIDETNQEIKIIHGVSFWTEGGTKQQTPDEMKIIETISQKFNLTGAVIGVILGFISYYLIFWL